jgi:hypothetical protein
MQLADRRCTTRFEIVGELWGSVQALEPVRVCNLAPEGALVESPTPLPVGSVQPVRLVRGTEITEVRGTVRHLSPVPAGDGGVRYRVGLRFLNVGDEAAGAIGRFMDENRDERELDEA